MQKRTLTHELMAEFFGTFLLILGGDGVVANVGLAPRLASQGYDWNTIVWGWGLSVMVAVYVAGGVSGAHINPAVTLAMAVKRGFPWGKVVPYFVAQIAGAFVGALGVYLKKGEVTDILARYHLRNRLALEEHPRVLSRVEALLGSE